MRKPTDTLFYKKSREIGDRIVRQAFDIAMTRGKKLTSVDKANVLAKEIMAQKTVNEISDRISGSDRGITLYVDEVADENYPAIRPIWMSS